MTNTYCGESWGKKFARSLMFNRAVIAEGLLLRLESLDRSTHFGEVVTLCGYEAADVRIARMVYGEDAWINVIDRDEQAIANNRHRFRDPGENILWHVADIATWLKESQCGIRLAVLDLMGHVNDTMLSCLPEIGRRLVPGGCVLLTYLRAREGKHSWWYHQCKKSARKLYNDSTPQAIRAFAYMTTVKRGLGLSDVVYLGECWYNSGHSPMTTIGFQYAPAKLQHKEWKRAVDKMRPAILPTNVQEAERLIKRQILIHANAGASDLDIADTFNLDVKSIPAIKAHATRGTYAEDRA